MAFRQGRSTQATTDPTTLAYSSAVLSGSLLVCTIQAATTTSCTVSDSVNGSWTSAINHGTTNTANDSAVFFFANSAAGTPTVTVSGQGGGSPIAFTISEFTGVLTASPLDKTGSTEANGTSITSGSVTNTGTNGDLNVSVLASNAQNVTYSNTTSGWSLDVNNTPNATMSASMADATQVPAAAFTTTWGVSGSAQDLSVLVVSFQLAPPAAGAGQSLPRLVRANPAILRRELPFFSPQRYAYPSPSATQAIALSSDPSSSATTSTETATLASAVALSGSITSVGSLTATLAASVALSGPVAGRSTETATLAVSTALAGTVTAVDTDTATVSAAVALSGSIASVSTETGTATEAVALSGPITAPSAIAGNATSATPISGTVTSVTNLAASLTVAVALAGPQSSVSSLAATLAVAVALQGPVGVVSVLAATLAPVGPVGPGSVSAYDFPAFKVGFYDSAAFLVGAANAVAFKVSAYDAIAFVVSAYSAAAFKVEAHDSPA